MQPDTESWLMNACQPVCRRVRVDTLLDNDPAPRHTLSFYRRILMDYNTIPMVCQYLFSQNYFHRILFVEFFSLIT